MSSRKKLIVDDLQTELKKFEKYLIEEELSDSTMYTYLWTLEDFYKFACGDVFSKEKAISYKQHLMKEKSAKTVNLRLTALRKYYAFREIPITLKKVKVQQKSNVENVITLKQLNKMFDYWEENGHHDYAVFFKIISKTGARVSEALQFRKKHLDAGFCELHTKGKVRRILFPKTLRAEIADFYKDYKPEEKLLKNRYGNTLAVRGVDAILKDCAEKCGIPKEVAHVHGLRHLFAIEFLKRNENIALLADLLGHSGVNTTMIYLRMSKEDQQKSLDKAVNW